MGISKVQTDSEFEHNYISDGEAVDQNVANRPPKALKNEINFLDNFIKGNFGIEFLDDIPNWVSSNNYLKGQCVKHNNKRYISSADISNSQEPGNSSIWKLVHLDKIFDSIDINTISYNADDSINEISYVTGNKTKMNYDSNGDLIRVDYYETNGSTVIGAETIQYNSNHNITKTIWS